MSSRPKACPCSRVVCGYLCEHSGNAHKPDTHTGYPPIPLTDIEVRAAKTATTPKKLFDGGGLYLRIDSKGSKLWRMAYRFEGNYDGPALRGVRFLLAAS